MNFKSFDIETLIYGLETTFWDKTAKFDKVALLRILDNTIELTSKHADSNLLAMMEDAREKINPMIKDGKIKNSKQLIMTWQDAMGIYIIR